MNGAYLYDRKAFIYDHYKGYRELCDQRGMPYHLTPYSDISPYNGSDRGSNMRQLEFEIDCVGKHKCKKGHHAHDNYKLMLLHVTTKFIFKQDPNTFEFPLNHLLDFKLPV